MFRQQWIRKGLAVFLIIQALISLVPPTTTAYASQPQSLDRVVTKRPRPITPLKPANSPPLTPQNDDLYAESASNPQIPLANGAPTLTVNIISSPWAPVDNTIETDGAQVFVVQAMITSTTAITDVTVNLDYDPIPLDNWTLLNREDPIRTIDQLDPGQPYYAYWFARYALAYNAGHIYTVTANATISATTNVITTTTSENFYENPLMTGGEQEYTVTVKTVSAQDTGSSGLTDADLNVVVGTYFTVSVEFAWNENPDLLILSPVGNIDFEPGAYRLVDAVVEFRNKKDELLETVQDRLYFPDGTVTDGAEKATVTYTFVALTPADSQICPYATVGKVGGTTLYKYDNQFCQGTHIIPITGTLSFSMTKETNSFDVQQGQSLTYTIAITGGDWPMINTWIWDNMPPGIGTVTSVNPTASSATNERVIWDQGDIPAHYTRTFTVALSVDGQGQDLADMTDAVNYAFLGINEGEPPLNNPAMTSTVAITVHAPTIAIAKTGVPAAVDVGGPLTFSLRITNSGSITATNVVVTDELPVEVNYVAGAANPSEDNFAGQVLSWRNLPDIPPNGGTASITVPVTVDITVPHGTIIANTMAVKYENEAGHAFAVQTVTDTTAVRAPVLTISKSAYPDPLLAVPGHRLTYTLHYANSGPVAASGVWITDVLPVSTTFQACSGCVTETIGSDTVISWTLDTLSSNTQGTVTFSIEVITASIQVRDEIVNGEYGIFSEQTGFLAGLPVTTTVSKESARVNVYTFWDRNANGISDTLDVSLRGITVTLDGINVAQPMTGTTDSIGFYQFAVQMSGPISVSADMTSTATTNYFRTTPGTVFLDSELGTVTTVTFGYAPYTSTFGTVYGTVFEDTNHDGMQGQGENGLPNVTMTSTVSTIEETTTTDVWGRYVFSYTVTTPVTATLSENDPDFYVSTTPNVVEVTGIITGSNNSSPIDFGDFRGIQVTGQVFTDANINGEKDTGEGGIPGVTVAAAYGDATLGDSTLTDAEGTYTLYVGIRDSDPIQVIETDLAGYVSTSAIPRTAGMTQIDANTLSIDAPTSAEGYREYIGDFGDVLVSGVITVSGYVWNDNGAGGGTANDGVWDTDDPPVGSGIGSEPGLAGAVVGLDSGMTQTTGIDGRFVLYAPYNSSVITVTESDPAGYASTNAVPGDYASKLDNNTLVISPTGAVSTFEDNLFGDVLAADTALITGTVFDDTDEDGTFDGSDAGIAGVTVTLEISGGNTIVVHTDSQGNYQLTVAPGVDVRITSTGPTGYYPTTPDSVIVRPAAAGVYPNNNFGYSNDSSVAIIPGIVFDDANSNGLQDFGESGLAGAIITLTNGGPPVAITTSGNGLVTGTFAFSVPLPVTQAVYSVEEADPPGYRSTTPNHVNVIVVSDTHNYDAVTFGDTNSTEYGTIYGSVFEDINGNHVQDHGEGGLHGVVISVTLPAGGVLTSTTRPYGMFTYGFRLGLPALYTVREQDPALPGYRSTTPDEVTLNVAAGTSYVIDFGDAPPYTTFSTIWGTVFNDASNEDGVKQNSEEGIPGVDISLINGVEMTTTTDSYGLYNITVYITGPTQMVETDPIGYHSTTPNEVPINIAPATTYRVNFGDSPFTGSASFFGTVFDDQNANGTWDPTEQALSGVTVEITGTSSLDRYLDVTNEWGQFTFGIGFTGTYTVTETDLTDYVSTIAIPGIPDLISNTVARVDDNTLRAQVNSLGLGTSLGNNLFGDVRGSDIITISGYVWDDNGAGGGVAADGLVNGSEPRLAGATISLSSGMTQTTGSDGAFSLYAPPGQVITVTETNPTPDYISTNAVPGGGASRFDNDTLVITDTLSGGTTSSGNLFGDVTPVDLAVAKSVYPNPAAPGMVLTYTLTYTNNGPSFAQGVTITDTLPLSVTYGGVVEQPTGWSAPPTYDAGPPATLTWWYTSTLAADATGSIVFTVTVNSDASGTITNSVSITANTPDTNTDNNDDDAPTFIINPSIDIAKTPDVQLAESGAPVTFTITVTNTGDVTLTGVTVIDTPAPDCAGYLGTLDPTDSTSYTCTVVATQDFTNTASVTGSPPFGPDVSDFDTAFVDVIGPSILIVQSPNSQQVDIGSMATFNITITNTSDPNPGADTLTNVSVTDPLAPDCEGPVTDTLPVGDSVNYTCTVANVTADFTNFATVTGTVTGTARVVYDSDTAFVDVLPTLTITKTANPTSINEPGGTVTFTARVNNTGVETVTLTTLDDDVHGNLNGQGNCLVPQDILVGSSYSCTFTATVSGNADTSETDTITAQAHDDEGNNVVAQDSATVTIADVLPTIDVTKTANPTSVNVPGGDVTFTVRVDNTSVEAVTLITLTDDIHGDLDGQGSCALTQTIPAAGYYECAFVATVSGSDGYSETDTIIAWAQDDEGNPVSAQDSATVTVSAFATIYGTVFDDANSNGVQDAGEGGIYDVLVTLEGIGSTNTDANGGYTFSTTVPGAHRVIETDPAGYRSTTPNTVTLDVAMGNSYPVDFGDVLITTSDDFATIYGTVFNDVDSDGTQDPGETGISNVLVMLEGIGSTNTDANGGYTFSTTVPGAHRVIETDPTGYRSTTPNTVTLDVALGNSYQVDFGDVLITTSDDFATIYGTVFDDADSDGTQGPGETGISNVLVTLEGIGSTNTDFNGGYTFSTTVAGAHRVIETDPTDYQSTTPNTVTLDVALGNSYQVDFGDTLGEIPWCTCPADSYEDDDAQTQATPIQIGRIHSQSHDFCSDSTDWISFTATADDVYTITTSSWGQRADTYLALFDANGNLLDANDDYEESTDFSSRIVWQAPSDGVYYVRVTNQAGLTGCNTDYDIWVEYEHQETRILYLPLVTRNHTEIVMNDLDDSSLSEQQTVDAGAIEPSDSTVSLYPTGVITHLCPDSYEEDDTWETAGSITETIQTHSFDSDPQFYAADKDYVWFNVSPFHVANGKKITFTITAVTNTQPLMQLHDKYGTALDVTGTFTTPLVWTPDNTGRYYLSVRPQDGITTFADCVDNEAGYKLQWEMEAVYTLHLPLVVKDF